MFRNLIFLFLISNLAIITLGCGDDTEEETSAEASAETGEEASAETGEEAGEEVGPPKIAGELHN